MVTTETKHHSLHEAIAGIVGSKYVADEAFALVPYSRDVSAFPAVMPGIVVRPGSTEEVSEIVRLANRTGFPVTLKGGGQSGGGVTKGEPTRNIVLDLGRLDKVTDIDVVNQKVTYGGGIRPSMLDDALRKYGYFAYSVMGPYYTASVGGVISGIAGGGFSKEMASAGTNWRHILGLKVVLPTGDIITTGAGPDTNIYRNSINFREATTPDLTGLFISSGGAFGIITEVTQMINPIPNFSKPVSFVFDTMEDVWDAQLKLGAGISILQTSMIMFELENNMLLAGLGSEGYGALFMSVDGDNEEDVDLRIKRIERICSEKGHRGTPDMDYYAAHGCTGTGEFVHEICSNACPMMTWESPFTKKDSMEYCLQLYDIFNRHKEENDKYEFFVGLYTIPITNMMLVGFTLHWNDAIPGAGDHVRKVWKEGAEFMLKQGTSSAYAQGANSNLVSSAWSPAFSKLIGSIKKTLDPNSILCPGLWDL